MIGNGRPWMRWVLLGLVLMTFAKGFEAMGDAAPFAEAGVSGERLMFHGLALLLVVGAIACGFKVLRALFGSIGERGAAAPKAIARVFSDDDKAPQAPQEFDPDAAFARYMERKAAGEIQPVGEVAAVATRSGFGRKGA